MRTDLMGEFFRRAGSDVRYGDEIDRRMGRRELRAQPADPAAADDGEPDLFAFDDLFLATSRTSCNPTQADWRIMFWSKLVRSPANNFHYFSAVMPVQTGIQ